MIGIVRSWPREVIRAGGMAGRHLSKLLPMGMIVFQYFNNWYSQAGMYLLSISSALARMRPFLRTARQTQMSATDWKVNPLPASGEFTEPTSLTSLLHSRAPTPGLSGHWQRAGTIPNPDFMLTIKSPSQGGSNDVIVPVFQKSNNQTRKRIGFQGRRPNSLSWQRPPRIASQKERAGMLLTIVCYELAICSVLGVRKSSGTLLRWRVSAQK